MESYTCPYLLDLARWPERAPVRLTLTPAAARRGLSGLGARDTLYYGGPRLVGGTNIQTLATYPDGTAAVAARRVGKGEIVLVGPHLERPPPAEGGDEAPPPADTAALVTTLLGLPAR